MSFLNNLDRNGFLTNNKDVNTLILSKLEFKELRNVLIVNKETSVYNREVL